MIKLPYFHLWVAVQAKLSLHHFCFLERRYIDVQEIVKFKHLSSVNEGSVPNRTKVEFILKVILIVFVQNESPLFSKDGLKLFFTRAIPQGGRGKFFHISMSTSQVK